ncbi:MAG: hypothetical protein NC819_03860 [Candidatus Omnitrophica bacterium]|nr:hypothetical protein [Candidatus Omnitrophota bacterium]
MKESQRVLLATMIVIIDVVVIFVPLMALFAAYVLLFRPPFFRDWVEQIYQGP